MLFVSVGLEVIVAGLAMVPNDRSKLTVPPAERVQVFGKVRFVPPPPLGLIITLLPPPKPPWVLAAPPMLVAVTNVWDVVPDALPFMLNVPPVSSKAVVAAKEP